MITNQHKKMKYNTRTPIFFVLTFLSTFMCDTLGEPQCSPYHYQEQILERVIEMKFKMNQWAEKMEHLEALVNERVAILDEKLKQNEDLETKISDTREQLANVINSTIDENLKEMKSIITESINRVDEVISENQQIETRLQEVIVAQTSSLNASLVEQSRAIEEIENTRIKTLKTPVVLFKARDVKNRSPSTGDTIIFKTIVQNEGAGYNPDTGIFTAPEAGTYLFTVQFCLTGGKAMSFKVDANGLAITAAYFYEENYSYVCASSDGTAILNKGENVKVVVTEECSSGTVIYNDRGTTNWSYFSGVLLHI